MKCLIILFLVLNFWNALLAATAICLWIGSKDMCSGSLRANALSHEAAEMLAGSYQLNNKNECPNSGCQLAQHV